jgi:hypothetical protein
MSHHPTFGYYVDITTGNNSNSGRADAPVQTIAGGLSKITNYVVGNTATWVAAGRPVFNLYLAPGIYTQLSQTLDIGYVRIQPWVGNAASSMTATATSNGGVVIDTTSPANPAFVININAAYTGSTWGTAAQRQIVFENVELRNTANNAGCILANPTTAAGYTLVLQGCRIHNTGAVVNFQAPNGSDSTVIVRDCQIYQDVTASTLSVSPLAVNSGSLSMERTTVTAYQNQPAVVISGTATFNVCSINNFYGATSATAAQPIVRISSAAAYATPINNCLFAYTVTPSGTRPSTSAGIEYSGPIPHAAVLFNNLFLLVGTAEAGYAIYATDPLMPHFLYGSNNCSLFGQARLANVVVQGLTPILPG